MILHRINQCRDYPRTALVCIKCFNTNFPRRRESIILLAETPTLKCNCFHTRLYLCTTKPVRDMPFKWRIRKLENTRYARIYLSFKDSCNVYEIKHNAAEGQGRRNQGKLPAPMHCRKKKVSMNSIMRQTQCCPVHPRVVGYVMYSGIASHSQEVHTSRPLSVVERVR